MKIFKAIVVLGAVAILTVACTGTDDVPIEIRALAELDRGLEMQEVGNLQKAQEAYDAATRLDPQLAEGYARKGYVRIQYSDMNGALEQINRALNIDSELAIAYNYRGIIMASANNIDGALLDFAEAIRLDPTLVEAYLNRGRLFIEEEA